jgi:hypothetical protein
MRLFNYSSLSAAYQCQQYYKYTYIDGLKTPQNGDLAFGSAVHFAVEQSLMNEEDPVADFQVYWENVKKQDLKYGRYKHDDLSNMGEIFVSRFHNKYRKRIEPRLVEQELHTDTFRGTPDCVGEYEGVMSVIDFKTSSTRYNASRAFLSEQMHLYAHLAKETQGIDVKQLVYVVFLKSNTSPIIQVVSEEFNAEHAKRLLDNTKLQRDDLLKKEVDNTPFSRNLSNCIHGEFKCHFYDKCWKEKQ